MSMARIVLVGEDSSLLATRAEVLKRTGASIACSSARRAKSVMDEEVFDILVLCHSVADAVATDLIQYARGRWPEAKILMVVTANFGYRRTGAEMASADPNLLIERTQQLLESLPNHRLQLASWKEEQTDPECKIATIQ
jgi:DNA-binding NtrC family response regulator